MNKKLLELKKKINNPQYLEKTINHIADDFLFAMNRQDISDFSGVKLANNATEEKFCHGILQKKKMKNFLSALKIDCQTMTIDEIAEKYNIKRQKVKYWIRKEGIKMSRECNTGTEIAKILKELRMDKTLTEQANDLNSNLTLLSHIGNGRKPVSKMLLKKMIDFYNLSEKQIAQIKSAGVTKEQIEEAKNILNSGMSPNELAVYLQFER